MIPYGRLIAAGIIAIALALLMRWLIGLGYDHCELEHLKAQDKLISQAAERAAATDKKLADALAKLPKTGSKVERAVHDHPTSPDCVVPDSVVDALNEGINALK